MIWIPVVIVGRLVANHCAVQVAIAATDLAEIIGSAIALYLLFDLPVWAGCLITFAGLPLALIS